MGHQSKRSAVRRCGPFGNSDLLAGAIKNPKDRAAIEAAQRLSDSIFDFYQRRFRHALDNGFCPVCHGARPEMEYLCDLPQPKRTPDRRGNLARRAAVIMSGGRP